MRRDALFKLWSKALRCYPGAQTELHRLLIANPRIECTLKAFAAEREVFVKPSGLGAKAPASKQVMGAWARLS